MIFRKIQIPYAGRERYPSNGNGEAIARSLISQYFAGNAVQSAADANNMGDNRGTNANAFFAYLGMTSKSYSALELASTAITDTFRVYGFKNMNPAQTFVGDLYSSAATENYGISGMPQSGMTILVTNNGTSGTSMQIIVDNTISADMGELKIPVNVNINDNDIDPYHTTWHDNFSWVQTCTLTFTWTINRGGSSTYTMDLSNETAQVNCDSAGTIYSASTATLTCSASTYLGTTLVEGVIYSIFTAPQFNAHGVSIGQSTGVLTWDPTFGFDGAALPIDVIASLNGENIAVKTMRIMKNYPGQDGSPAVTHWILTSVSQAKFNPNTSAYTPSNRIVTAEVWKQVGYMEPERDTETPIYYAYSTTATTGITQLLPQTGATIYESEEYITFALKNAGGEVYEIETVPILWDGYDGENGAPGQNGADGQDGAPGESPWYLSLDNDNASINCDPEGNIYAGAIRPTCHLRLYHGTERQSAATYKSAATPSVTGASLTTSNGIGTISFGSSFNFTGDALSITVSGITDNEVRDVKVMTITKAYAGENGSGTSVSYWLELSDYQALYNPNTTAVTPTKITATAKMQRGEEAVINATGVAITFQGYTLAGSPRTKKSYPSTGVSITTSSAQTTSKVRFELHLINTGGSIVDTEEVPIMRQGVNGQDGTATQGRTGPAIRGPYDYYSVSGSNTCWCAGESAVTGTCTECSSFIDVLLKDNVYYYCKKSYNGKPSSYINNTTYWASGAPCDFVATGLLLADNAKIKFSTNNEIYLMDENGNVVGGARGTSVNSGITFWSGSDSPEEASFKVDYEGNVYAQYGVFAGYCQYPYTFVSDLPVKVVKYKLNSSTYTTSAFCADEKAYLISDSSNEASLWGSLTMASTFALPYPTVDLNGFTYEILVQPSTPTRTNPNDPTPAMLDIFVSGATASTSATRSRILCYAFADPRSAQKYRLTGGRYVITCIPRKNVNYTVSDYVWVITMVTGGLDVYDEHGNIEHMSTLLATSYDANPLNKVLTYTGSTKPTDTVTNTNQIMYIKK